MSKKPRKQNALDSLSAAPEKREQEVFTPASVLDPVRDYFGARGIELDPAAPDHPARSLVRAPRNYTKAMAKHGQGGLDLEWTGNAFCNPVFDDLEAWLCQARTSFRSSVREGHDADIVMIAPVRSHRLWWSRYLQGACVALLKPVIFEGFKEDFPAPLFLAAFAKPSRWPRFQRCISPIATGWIDIKST